jgi:hypothetical protein
VKQTAEDQETLKIHQQLRNSVFAGACSNWYIGDFGRNAASWPGTAASFWAKTFFPKWSAFELTGGSKAWPLYAAVRQMRNNIIAIILGVVFTSVTLSFAKFPFVDSLLS